METKRATQRKIETKLMDVVVTETDDGKATISLADYKKWMNQD